MNRPPPLSATETAFVQHLLQLAIVSCCGSVHACGAVREGEEAKVVSTYADMYFVGFADFLFTQNRDFQ